MRRSIIPATIIALALAGCGSSLEESDAPAVDKTTAAAESTDEVTEEPTEEEPVEEASDLGTYTNPFPQGTSLKNDYLTIKLGKTEVGVDKLISAANQFNESAPKGQVYNRVKVTLNNTGEEKVSGWDITIKFIDKEGNSYEQAFAAGDELKDIMDMSDLYPGGKETVYFYYTAPKDSIKSGIYAVSPLFGEETFVKAS